MAKCGLTIRLIVVLTLFGARVAAAESQRCNAGYTGPAGECEPCPAGTYKPNPGPGGLRVSNQTRRCHSNLNGLYVYHTEHAGKPAYKRRGGQEKIYWEPKADNWGMHETLGSTRIYARSASSDLFGQWDQFCDGGFLRTHLRIHNEGCLPCPRNTNSTPGSSAATNCKCNPVHGPHTCDA